MDALLSAYGDDSPPPSGADYFSDLDNTKARTDDDLDLAVSKLSELLEGGCGLLSSEEANEPLSDDIVFEISKQLAEVMHESPGDMPSYISEDQRKKVFGDHSTASSHDRSRERSKPRTPAIKDKSAVQRSVAMKQRSPPSTPQTVASPSTIIYQHDTSTDSPARNSKSKSDIDEVVERMSRYQRLHEEKLANAQKKQVAEQLKEMKSKPEISKKSRQMTPNYIPIYDRVDDIIKDKKEHINKMDAEKRKKEEETLTAMPTDIPESHYRKNRGMGKRANSASKQWTKEFQAKKKEALDKKREEQERDQLKAALQNDGDRKPFQPKIDSRSQKMARLHPWGAEEIGERLYKDSQKRKAQQESRQRSVANPTLAINERSRALKQVGDVCSRLYEKGMVKERERRNIQSEKWEQSVRVHKPSRLLDEEPLAGDAEVPFGAGVYMLPMSTAYDEEDGSDSASAANVVNFVPYDPQYLDVFLASDPYPRAAFQ